MGVSNRTVSRWENGNNMPDISLLSEIAEFYDVSIPELIYGEKKRVVLIDYWKLAVEDKVIEKKKGAERSGLVKDLMVQKVWGNEICDGLGIFLCRMTGKSDFEGAVRSFGNFDRKGPMVSQNGCLMLFIGGFKAASNYRDEIYGFLNS